jgi:hypothetical protein
MEPLHLINGEPRGQKEFAKALADSKILPAEPKSPTLKEASQARIAYVRYLMNYFVAWFLQLTLKAQKATGKFTSSRPAIIQKVMKRLKAGFPEGELAPGHECLSFLAFCQLMRSNKNPVYGDVIRKAIASDLRKYIKEQNRAIEQGIK